MCVKNELGWGIGIGPDSLAWVWKSFMGKIEPMQLSHESKKGLQRQRWGCGEGERGRLSK